MKVKFDDIELALEFVSSGLVGEHNAYLCLQTGHIYYESDYCDEELPGDIWDDEKYLPLPSKQDLDLGRRLAMEFAAQSLGDDYETVYRMFQSKGAFGRFKSFLQSRNLLNEWYEYQNEQQRTRLVEWCQDNDVELEI